jgi:hypothetical protein
MLLNFTKLFLRQGVRALFPYEVVDTFSGFLQNSFEKMRAACCFSK